MSVYPFAWNNSAHIEQIFYEIWYLSIFQRSVEKIQVWWKCDKNNGHFAWRPMYIYDNIVLNSSKDQKYFRQKF